MKTRNTKMRLARATLAASALACAGAGGIACSAIAGLDRYWEDPCFDASCRDGSSSDVVVLVGDDQSAQEVAPGDVSGDITASSDMGLVDGSAPDSTISDAYAVDVAYDDNTATHDASSDSSMEADAARPCQSPELMCNGTCVPNDLHNCGICGNDCTAYPGVLDAGLACTAGNCEYTCAPGYADCGFGCAQLSTDSANCNNCGHSCQGGSCQNGKCQPVIVASNQSAGLFEIAVNATNVYWLAGNGNVLTCPLTGCPMTDGGQTPVLFASGPAPIQDTGLWADNTNVYWGTAAGGVVLMCGVGGCGSNPVVLASQQKAQAIAVSGADVYWTNYNVGIAQCAISGCNNNPSIIASEQGPLAIAADSNYVYWTNNTGHILRCRTNACPASTVTMASGQNSYSIVVDSINIYWINGATNATGDNGTVASCRISGCPVGSDGGADPNLLASGQMTTINPQELAVDSDYIYWINAGTGTKNGSVMACAIGGCPSGPTTIATGQAVPEAIALDSRSVYWTNGGDGTVMKVAK